MSAPVAVGAPSVADLAAVEPGPEPDPDVLARLGLKATDRMRATRRSLCVVLTHDPRWAGRVVYDGFRRVVTLDRAPVEDHHLTRISCWIEEVYGGTAGRELLHECASLVAHDHAVHPVQDWLGTLCWDGVERLGALFPTCFGADDSPLVREMGRAWLVGGVARAQAPGCKLDTAVVLVGPQGIGKSRACRALMPDPDWFADTALDLGSKDAYVNLDGVWLYELAELLGLRGRGAERTKGFLSSAVDTYRAPYARTAQRVPRQCFFVATTNEPEFLEDTTGSRRFWPVRATRIDLGRIQRDRDQLWAEAAVRYARGETWHLDTTLEIERNRVVEPFQRTDALRERLEVWVRAQEAPFSTDEALTFGLQLPIDRGAQTCIGSLLRSLHCRKFQHRDGGERRWLWEPPPLQE